MTPERPSPEVERRISSLYDRAETDSGTYNATRAMSKGGRSRSDSVSGRAPRRSDPVLDSVAKEWFDVARGQFGPSVPAALPPDRRPRPANSRGVTLRRRPELDLGPGGPGGPGGRELAAPSRLELTAGPSASAAPEPVPEPASGATNTVGPIAELTAGPAATAVATGPLPALPATPEEAPPAGPALTPVGQDLTYTGQFPALTGEFVASAGQYAESAGQYAVPTGQFPAPTGQFAVPTGQFTVPTGQFTVPAASAVTPPAATDAWQGSVAGAPASSAGRRLAASRASKDQLRGKLNQARELLSRRTARQSPQPAFAAGAQQTYPGLAQPGFAAAEAQQTLGGRQAFAAQAQPSFPGGEAQASGQESWLASVRQTGGVVDASWPAPPYEPVAQQPAGTESFAALPLPTASEAPAYETPPAPVAPPAYEATPPSGTPSVPAAAAPVTPSQPFADPMLGGFTGFTPVPETAASAYERKAAKALEFARAQLGKPCVWGATGPDSYDCSSLAQAAWRVAGVELPRSASQQTGSGTPIELSDLRPGDLVFFYADASHVGIYGGNSAMVHAPGPGAPIREESVFFAGPQAIHSAVRPA
ncbi:NlpC/P60 family protein [Streptomyces anandii]|uniref:NlpC/P60 family protein n=1 Tax=Streptomyces anandii TaxID=285454 RepID=UPI003790815C